MFSKTDFSAEEWALLLRSPMLAGMAVTAADPSGLIGLLKESFAGGAAMVQAATDPAANELVKAVAGDFQNGEGREIAREGLKAEFGDAQPTEIKAKAVAGLRQASDLLAAKAPADAQAFRDWLRTVGEKTAAAASEGGSLFASGPAVSDVEKAVLAEISAALSLGA